LSAHLRDRPEAKAAKVMGKEAPLPLGH